MNVEKRLESLAQTLFAIRLGTDSAVANLEGEQPLVRDALQFVTQAVKAALADLAALEEELRK